MELINNIAKQHSGLSVPSSHLADNTGASMGGDIANQPRQGFFPIPAQLAQYKTQRICQIGVAADADIGHQGVRSADQLGQTGEGKLEDDVGCRRGRLGKVAIAIDEMCIRDR